MADQPFLVTCSVEPGKPLITAKTVCSTIVIYYVKLNAIGGLSSS